MKSNNNAKLSTAKQRLVVVEKRIAVYRDSDPTLNSPEVAAQASASYEANVLEANQLVEKIALIEAS